MIYSFKNDYSEGVHENILKRIAETNAIQQEGYSEDEYCNEAAEIIKNKINNQNAEIHFISGGTQTNLIIISSLLRPYESVISASTGHIAVHEAGAIEATGHKINTIDTPDGKLTPELIKKTLEFHTDEHMVLPAMVYISNSTEMGTIYSKAELTALSEFCKQNNLYLFLDGARLSSALASDYNDMTIADIAALTDVFYLGGTKNGAMFGEAVVIPNPELIKNFRFAMKQRGALLAKGRFLGIQFAELMKDDLYLNLAKHACKTASKLAQGIKNAGYKFLAEPQTNLILPILPNKLIDKLSKKFGFYVWEPIDNEKSCIRLVTSWATQEKYIDMFIKEMTLSEKESD